LATCALTSDLAITELGVRDASGAPLDLGGLTSLTAGLDGRMDLGLGRVELARLNLAAGPVQAAAHGSISGLPIGGAALDPAALSVADSEFLLDADLDRLSLAARPFLRAGTDFGGRLHVTSTASTAGRRVDAVSSVELTGLRLRLPASSADGAEAAAGAGTGALAGASGAGGHPAGAAGAASSAARELGPLDLTFSPSGHLDLAPGGALEITSLSLRSAFVELDGDGAFTDALDGQRRAGSLTTRLRVVPGAASAACAGFLDGLVAAGEDVTVQSVLRIEGARSGLVTQVRAPALALHGGALGDQPLSLADLALDADVALDGATQVVQIASLKVAAGPASAAGRELPGLQLTLRGAWDGARGTLDVPELSLVSAIANGGGRLHADHVAQPGEGLAVQADVHFSGDAEPARALLAAFVPELAPARAAGGWELSLVADGSGTATHARPRLALHGVSLEGYVANGQALPLKDVDLALDAELTADTSGTGRITLGKLTLQAPGMTATADGHAAGYAASTGAASTASTGASGTSGTSGAASSADAAGLASARNPIPAELDAGVQATFTLEPHELSDRLAAFLGGVTLGGETLSGQLHAEALHGVLVTQGRLSSHELQVGLPADAAAGTPARQLVQRGLQLDLDATLDLTPGADRVTLRSARLASSTAQASVTGTLGGVLEPATASADVTVSVRSELTALFADLGPLLPLPGWSGSGALALDGTLRGDAGRLALKSTTTIDRLALSIPRAAGAAAAAPGGDALAVGDALLIDDPHVALDVEASVATGPMDVELGAARIGSTFLSGTLGGRLLALSSAVPRAENLRGDFTWVPGRVGALLGPLLPGELSGEERQPLRFVLDGPLPSGDLPALLAGASAGATIGLGTLALPGVVASGTTTTELQAGRAHVTGQLALNGGSAALDARLDLRPQGSAAAPLDTTLDLRFERVQVSQEMAALLAHVHPLLEAGEGQSLGVLSGAIGGSLLLDWPAPLPLPPAASASGAPAAGASVLDTLPLEALSGTAMLDFGTLTVASSPLLGQMLDHLGLAGTQSFTLAPVKLVVRDGRVGYAEPWAWTIQNIPTAFSGSVGLDQSLDLSWSVPITEALAGKHGFLKNLKGQSLVIPLRGTVAAPDLQWTAALENLAQQALASGLQEKIGEKLGPLGGLLGGGKKASGDKAGGDAAGSGAQPGAGGDAAPPSGLPGPVASPAVTPESLLAQADALWDKGSKAEAKVLYKQLKSDFKLTLTYQLNKKRVDERGKWKPGG
ncbi:MAG TPA: hypothetical protein VK824_08095, partial [Planctomycetota bacterium]|nr:hypothetical protein [Planctomycetota bacterium]